MNVISIIGNVLCYFDMLHLIPKILITVASVITVAYFNVQGVIGILPLIAIITYLWLMNLEDVTHFKILIVFVMMLWIVYDFSIKSYTATAFDVITVIANVVAIIKIQIAKKKGVNLDYEKKNVV